MFFFNSYQNKQQKRQGVWWVTGFVVTTPGPGLNGFLLLHIQMCHIRGVNWEDELRVGAFICRRGGCTCTFFEPAGGKQTGKLTAHFLPR